MATNRPQRLPRVPSIEAGSRLELLFVSAILTVLGVRFYLHLTGYPQVSGGELHIAHLLWGGLLMLIGSVMMLSYLGRRVASAASVASGVGFGLFIDEIGKFITKDNDYFYRPAIALIFVVFVLFFFAVRIIERRQTLTRDAALANALDLAKNAVVHGWTPAEKTQALALVQQCDPNHPLVAGLNAALAQIPTVAPKSSSLARAARQLVAISRQLVRARWFRWLALAICLAKMAEAIGWTTTVAAGLITGTDGVSFFDLLTIFGTIVAVVPVTYGLWLLQRGRRLHAYSVFKQTAFLSFFLVTLLSFYWNQFGGVLDLGFNLAVLGSLQHMINQERRSAAADLPAKSGSMRNGQPQFS